MKTRALVCSLVVTLCLGAGWANAQVTIYVSQDGTCGGHTLCYSTIQDAIDSVALPSIIKITQETYHEDVVLDVDQTITLEGGCDTSFTSCSSYTVIRGSLMIADGTTIVGGLGRIILSTPPPTINSFTANPATIDPGGSSTLSWSITNATSASIDHGVGSVNPAAGSTSVCPASNTTYTMTAANGVGHSTAQSMVTVSAGEPLDWGKYYDLIEVKAGTTRTFVFTLNRAGLTGVHVEAIGRNLTALAEATFTIPCPVNMSFTQPIMDVNMALILTLYAGGAIPGTTLPTGAYVLRITATKYTIVRIICNFF